jgi:hypothetical protein
VWNCMVLTEGFDEPTASCAIIARPTKSAGLYQQMVGRVLRPDLTLPVAERGYALVMDVVGVSRKMDLRSLVDLSTREDLPEDLGEDLSLLEMEDMIFPEEEEEGPSGGSGREETWYVGPADTKDFDPLGRDSDKVWGVTPGGNYFLTAGSEQYIFLTESLEGEPGTYDVVWCTKRQGAARGAGMTEHLGLPLPEALSWGEEEALSREGARTLAAKNAPWRKKPASANQVTQLRRQGYVITEPQPDVYMLNGEVLTKGDCSRMIDEGIAFQRIDSLVRVVRSKV